MLEPIEGFWGRWRDERRYQGSMEEVRLLLCPHGSVNHAANENHGGPEPHEHPETLRQAATPQGRLNPNFPKKPTSTKPNHALLQGHQVTTSRRPARATGTIS